MATSIETDKPIESLIQWNALESALVASLVGRATRRARRKWRSCFLEVPTPLKSWNHTTDL